MPYKWEITKDYINDDDSEIGTQGGNVDLVSRKEGRFRMYDDDANLYFEGKIHGNFAGFEPLDDLGMPGYGCTTIKYWKNNTWEIL